MWPRLLATIAALSWGIACWAAPPKKHPQPRNGASAAANASDQPQDVVSPTSVGPTSPAEASLLWTSGKEAYKEGRYHDAVELLARLVERYPASQGYLDAHLMLGTSWLHLGEAARAEAPLRYYVEALGSVPASWGARALLGQSYLEQEKYSEADLLADEMVRLSGSSPEDSAALLAHAQALLLKAQSLFGLKRDTEARRSLRSAQDLLRPHAKDKRLAPARAQSAYVALALRARDCSRLPSAPTLPEDQARDQINRRGDCVAALMPLFRGAIRSGDVDWVAPASHELLTAISGYKRVCENPPAPAPLREGKRTKKQAAEYERELADRLIQDCVAREKRALELLHSWKSEVPAKLAAFYAPVERSLEASSTKEH